MNPPQPGAPDGASNTNPAQPGQAGAGAPANGGAAPGQGGTGEAWRNEAEIKAYFKRVQALEAELAELRKGTTPPATPPAAQPTPKPGEGGGQAPAAPVDANAIAMQAAARAGFEVALGTSGLSDAQASMLRTIFAAEQPKPEAIGQWMKDKLAAFGRTQGSTGATAAPASATTPQSGARTDLGAPGGAGGVQPQDPRAIPVDQWKAMDPAERHKITKAWMQRSTGNGSALLRRNPR